VALVAASMALLVPARHALGAAFWLATLCDCTQSCRSAVFLLLALQGFSSKLMLVLFVAWSFSYQVLGVANARGRVKSDFGDDARLIDQWMGCLLIISVVLGIRNPLGRAAASSSRIGQAAGPPVEHRGMCHCSHEAGMDMAGDRDIGTSSGSGQCIGGGPRRVSRRR